MDPERRRLVAAEDQDHLADTFDAPSDDDDESDDEAHRRLDDRQRVLSGRPADAQSTHSPDTTAPQEPRVYNTAVPTSSRVYGGGSSSDGVFANLSAKPQAGESDLEEKPPSYEQAAADATPPYWETTILTPGFSSDEVFIDGLPVGSLFSFIWNGMISMSFQFVGFLLTYLLHTTHAAKNGSKAGLGITLIQYGFSLKASGTTAPEPAPADPNNPDFIQPPDDPNNHSFDPNKPAGDGPDSHGVGAMRPTDWFAYALMIVGWFILIRSISQYTRARRHEQVVLQSPSRGLNIPIVADGERPESSV